MKSIWMVFVRTSNIGIVIRIAFILVASSWSELVVAAELEGKIIAGSLFSMSVTSKSREPDGQEFLNDLVIVYGSDGVKLARTYKFPARAPAVVAVSQLGFVSIGERVGGMNGIYTVTYLVPESDGLKHVGGVEINMSDGKFVSVATVEPRWDTLLGEDKKKVWLDQVTNRAKNFFISGKNSIENAFLLFAVPELMSRLSTNDHNFAEQYSKYLISHVDSSIGNLIRRHFVGKGRSLCDDEQFDVFACRVSHQAVSICLDERDGVKRLEYRFGNKNNVQLKLSKAMETKFDDSDLGTSFLNGAYTYTIKDGNSATPLILVGKNGLIVLRKPCSRGDVESMIFPIR